MDYGYQGNTDIEYLKSHQIPSEKDLMMLQGIDQQNMANKGSLSQ
jgi:hypothetical protein